MEKNQIQNKKRTRSKAMVMLTLVALVALSAFSFAEVPDPTPQLSLQFDFSSMFEWTQTILNALMPVMYITLGISLAFVILRALKGAFA